MNISHNYHNVTKEWVETISYDTHAAWHTLLYINLETFLRIAKNLLFSEFSFIKGLVLGVLSLFQVVLWPADLRHLTFGNHFSDLEQMNFPDLESLIFGDEFRQNLENVKLPVTLRSLSFGKGGGASLRSAKQMFSKLQVLKCDGLHLNCA